MSAVRLGATVTSDEFIELPETNLRCELWEGLVAFQDGLTMAQERLSERFVGYMLASLENAGLTGVYVPHYVLLSAEYGDEFTTPGLVILDEGRANNDGAIWIDGAPDIVFEVVFTDLWLDVMSRRPWYAAAGVAEYWILDADAATLTTLALGPDNQYTERGVLTAADTLTTPLFPKFSLPLAQLFEHPSRIRR